MKPAPRLLTGGSGYLAGRLARHWHAAGHRVVVLSRHPAACARHLPPGIEIMPWDGLTLGPWTRYLDGAEVLVNLAGKSVDCRYTPRNRAKILSSRLDSTGLLATALAACARPPPVWLNASSATYYRHAEDRPQDEVSGEAGAGFSVEVCRAWEKAFFTPILPPGVRRVALRTAIVLGRDGGAFPVFDRLARFGLGGSVAGGCQMFSWLHEEDFCRAVDWLITTPALEGPVNLSAPGPVPLRRFQALLRRSHHVPCGLPLPKAILRVGAWLIRTEPELLLKSRWVLPRRLLENGFRFRYPTLAHALPALGDSQTRGHLGRGLEPVK